MKWTRDQQKIIDARNSNLLVSAAAGSGKTAVLVERIIQMVCDKDSPINIDRLLVVTFTKAAASQMKDKIRKAIENEIEEEPENQHFQQQLLNGFSYCQYMLKTSHQNVEIYTQAILCIFCSLSYNIFLFIYNIEQYSKHSTCWC